MSAIDQLSSVLGKKGNDDNIALANQIAMTKNTEYVQELVDNLANKNKRIQSDCIKTLYEIGYIAPELIAEYYTNFLQLLSSKNNRLVWGGMAALATIADLKSRELFDSLELIMDTMDKGSVITIDGGVEILGKLNKYDEFYSKTNPLIIEQLKKCPIKQMPQYLEKSIDSICERNKNEFLAIIDARYDECEKESQKKRLKKIINKIS